MNGILYPHIVQEFKVQFEENCIQLLLESCDLLPDKNTLKELSENNITVRLIGLMKSNPKRTNLQISIERESHHDEELTYKGFKDADESVRIDIKYSTWNSKVEYEYYIEAKNLSENNWVKTSTNSKVDALKQQKRYLETGINNFITGKYPQGCLVGYIVEGNPNQIASKINELLRKANKSEDQLQNIQKKGFKYFYLSRHRGTKMEELKHYFLNFN